MIKKLKQLIIFFISLKLINKIREKQLVIFFIFLSITLKILH
jgi:hypothetical protein